MACETEKKVVEDLTAELRRLLAAPVYDQKPLGQIQASLERAQADLDTCLKRHSPS
jgi:hypothetical protein